LGCQPLSNREEPEARNHEITKPRKRKTIGVFRVFAFRVFVFAFGVRQTLGALYFPATSIARKYSRVMRAMFEIGISFGHTASHSPSFEQLPNPSPPPCPILP